MIYTCTLNPAIDLFVATEKLVPREVNRTYEEEYQANGKGINISLILKKLGVNNTALGFIGGFTGKYIQEQLDLQGVSTDFIEVDGITRVNTFVHTDESEYKIVNRGPQVDPASSEELLCKIKGLPNQSTLFVSGSLPRGLEDEMYVEISRIAYEKDITLILDISSKVLLDCLTYKPYLIKPNREELAHFYNRDLLTDEEVIELGYDLLKRGAQRVLVSLGEEGAIYIDKDHLKRVSTAEGKVINTACSGDTMLAMFFYQLTSGNSIEQALKKASAAGASTAFSKGLSDLQDVDQLVKQITCTNL